MVCLFLWELKLGRFNIQHDKVAENFLRMIKTIITEERVSHMVETDPQRKKLEMIP